MSGLEQTIGTLVLLVGAFLAVVYGGGYLWHVFVGYPLANWRARKSGIVVVGENAFGDSVFVNYAEKDWRRATFTEWRKEEIPEGESSPALWPTRDFEDEEFLC